MVVGWWWGGGGVGWPEILVSAPVPLELILTGFDWALGVWDLGRGLTINHLKMNVLTLSIIYLYTTSKKFSGNSILSASSI